jgi:site-specific recombinase XerD
MLLNDAVNKFGNYQESIDQSVNTIHAYHNDLMHFNDYLVRKYNFPSYVEDITSDDVENYLLYLKQEKGYKSSSRKRKLVCLRTFFHYCFKKKLCQHNPAVDVEMIKVKHEEKMYLSEEEVQQIMKQITHPLINLVVKTLYYTGIRISECIHLQMRDIDFKNNVMHVHEKGGNKRIIPLNNRLREELLDYKENLRPYTKTDNFFATAKTGRISRSYTNTFIKQAVTELGWTKKISCHSMRHSCASSLVKKNINVVVIQKLLGHKYLSTTTPYMHAHNTDLLDAVNAL